MTIAAPDPSGPIAFYDAALGALGLVRLDELVDEEEDGAGLEAVGWGAPDGASLLWVVTADAPTSGLHVRLRAAAADVDAFHRAAVAAGGRSHAPPRRWVLYRRGEYGASVADPLGNVLEVVAAE